MQWLSFLRYTIVDIEYICIEHIDRSNVAKLIQIAYILWMVGLYSYEKVIFLFFTRIRFILFQLLILKSSDLGQVESIVWFIVYSWTSSNNHASKSWMHREMSWCNLSPSKGTWGHCECNQVVQIQEEGRKLEPTFQCTVRKADQGVQIDHLIHFHWQPMQQPMQQPIQQPMHEQQLSWRTAGKHLLLIHT